MESLNQLEHAKQARTTRSKRDVASGTRHWLIWLNWPVEAFRINSRSLAVFKTEVASPGDKVTVVRSERAFLRVLPTATHVVTWEFKKEWFTRASKLRLLATPGAGRELLPTDDELPPGVVRINGKFHGTIMSETVVAFMFAHARGLYAAEEFRKRSNNLFKILDRTV